MIPAVSDALHVRMAPPVAGWIDVTIDVTIDRTPVTVTFSASHTPWDSIGELAAALLRVAQAQTVAEVFWNEEPDEIRTTFSRRGGMIELRVDAHERSRRTARPSTLFTHEARVDEIIEPFVAALNGVRANAADYESSWGCAFPDDALQRLLALRDR